MKQRLLGLFSVLTLLLTALAGQNGVVSADDECVIPDSGPWPACATGGTRPPSASDCVIPESGPWPPCATGGSVAEGAGECVIPASGPWPSCATGGSAPAPTPPQENSAECVIPASGPWPPCAVGGGGPAPAPTQDVTLPQSISLTQFADGFNDPVYITHADDSRLFVVERAGRVYVLNQDGTRQLYLDISDRVLSDESERGLLSIAFHPFVTPNRRVFVYYTDIAADVVVSEFRASGNVADRQTEKKIIVVEQPAQNHNGGQIQFGPDNYLYIGLGDGGGSGDPLSHGQNPSTLLGSMLRININGPVLYNIPVDNPFFGDPAGRDEVWAYGLRNPWRFSFDRQTGDLYIADVGQGEREEVNFQRSRTWVGHNYGWNAWEGTFCHTSACNSTEQTAPVLQYDHSQGCSVTGGYVYRGSEVSQLWGNYLYGDFCNGNIWAAHQVNDGDWVNTLVNASGLFISSFGEDVNGELYVIDYVSGTIYKVGP